MMTQLEFTDLPDEMLEEIFLTDIRGYSKSFRSMQDIRWSYINQSPFDGLYKASYWSW